MADESITQNEGGYELLAVLVFILGTPLGLLLYEKGGETEHVSVELAVIPPILCERWLVIVTELDRKPFFNNGENDHCFTNRFVVFAESPVRGREKIVHVSVGTIPLIFHEHCAFIYRILSNNSTS